MDIEINSFRGIIAKKLYIPNECVSLISGQSGSGKSTILSAIYWCLFGSLKNVRTFGTKSGKCNVTLKINDISICRSKSPEELIYNDGNLVLNGKEAQEKINDIFGTKDTWLSCCYISQGSRNYFLSSNAETRMNILSELSFAKDDPTSIISKIEDNLEKKTKEYLYENTYLSTNLESYKKRRQELSIKKSDNLSISEYDELLKLISSNDIDILQKKLINVEKQLTLLTSLKEQKQRLLDIVPNNIDDTDYSYNLEDIITKIQIRKKLDELDKKIFDADSKNILEMNIDGKLLDHDIIKKINYRDNIYNKRKEVSTKLSIQLSLDEFEKAFHKRKGLLDAQQYLSLLKRKEELEDKYDRLTVEVTKLEKNNKIFYNEEEINSKLNDINKMKDILVCPSCNSGLKYMNKKLVKEGFILNEIEIENIKNTIDNSREHIRISNEIETIKKSISEIDGMLPENIDWENIVSYPLLNNDSKQRMEKEIYLLNEVIRTYDEDLISDDITVDILKLQDKKYHLLQLMKDYEEIKQQSDNRTYSELMKEKKELENKIKDINDKKGKKKTYEDEIYNIDNKLSKIIITDDPEDIRNDIEKKKKEISGADEKIKKWKEIQKINEEKKGLEDKRSQLIILERNVQNLSYLKHIANEVEHITMSNVIETINNYINEILMMIFEHPITVEFSVFKVNKSNSSVKPSINLKIFYKGYEIDSLNSLSGGEADRVSLAVTLALSKFSSCPLILLDEFASGLDVATKELVIKSIRSSSEGKIILCISHDTVEGIYDFVEKM